MTIYQVGKINTPRDQELQESTTRIVLRPVDTVKEGCCSFSSSRSIARRNR